MFNQEEFLKLLVDLKKVEAKLKCVIEKECPSDKVISVTNSLHKLVLRLENNFWHEIEIER